MEYMFLFDDKRKKEINPVWGFPAGSKILYLCSWNWIIITSVITPVVIINLHLECVCVCVWKNFSFIGGQKDSSAECLHISAVTIWQRRNQTRRAAKQKRDDREGAPGKREGPFPSLGVAAGDAALVCSSSVVLPLNIEFDFSLFLAVSNEYLMAVSCIFFKLKIEQCVKRLART